MGTCVVCVYSTDDSIPNAVATTPSDIVIGLYVIMMCCIACGSELGKGLTQFAFLRSYTGKGLFYLLVGVLALLISSHTYLLIVAGM